MFSGPTQPYTLSVGKAAESWEAAALLYLASAKFPRACVCMCVYVCVCVKPLQLLAEQLTGEGLPNWSCAEGWNWEEGAETTPCAHPWVLSLTLSPCGPLRLCLSARLAVLGEDRHLPQPKTSEGRAGVQGIVMA